MQVALSTDASRVCNREESNLFRHPISCFACVHEICGLTIAQVGQPQPDLRFLDGQGVVVSGGASTWAHTYMQLAAVVDTAGQLRVTKRVGADWQEHGLGPNESNEALAKLCVRTSNGASTWTFQVLAHSQPSNGAFLMWSLPELWRALGGDRESQWSIVRDAQCASKV